ncbi:hypothetical protein G4Y79_24215 [Phototrophicus methaneseepsis]|uniref:STAS domain-containing protein n=1 Tax=Phototrophicus methaneseepsis TaxID=2710758 RepID=A0A7S8E9A9_9CHLR|nr:hypothetical protein [Phototrophicus methaneseepsis]QPC82751.1 hypothetical protein G4Y79_24215 [Phototrophicus methaneseepsis]
MPIRIGWYDHNQTIIYVQFVARWTTDEYRQMLVDSYDLIDSVDGDVVVLLNFIDSQSLPLLIVPLLKQAVFQTHPRTSLIVVVGASEMLLRLGRVVQRAYPVVSDRTVIAPSLTSANQLIEKHQHASITMTESS